MRKMTIGGVPYCLMTDGWWLEEGRVGDPTGDGEDTPVRPGRDPRLWLLAALVLLADLLFWREAPGLSVALFGLALMAAMTAVFAPRPRLGPAWSLGTVGLLPVVENLSLLSFVIAMLALLAFGAALAVPHPLNAERLIAAVTRLGLRLFWFSARAACADLPVGVRALTGSDAPGRLARAWALPIAAGLLFLLLFADANPILSDLLERSLAFDWLTGELVARTLFWALVAYLCWPFLALDRIGSLVGRAGTGAGRAPWSRPLLINAASVGNSLMLFNLMFAAQSLSDVVYLWSGAALPDGMTLAQYAHRGAYPLVLTALLAGLFALVARPFVQEDRRLLGLLALWLAQNAMLVAASLYRLDLYVDSYGLTYLRVAAAIWMGLVAGGLGLIFWQIARRNSSGWLIAQVTALAVVTLYGCCFVNFADMIARKNIALYLRGATEELDCYYLWMLGANAVPAVRERWLAIEAQCLPFDFPDPQPRDWRDWGFRSWRIGRY